MKRFILAILAILTLGTTTFALDLPENPGFALLGIIDAPAYGPLADNSVYGGAYSVHELYFILIYPERYWIGGVEFACRFDPIGFESNVVIMNTELPGGGMLLQPAPWEYLIGYNQPIPAPESQAMVMHLTVMLMSDAIGYVKLGPVSLPSIPGEMAYTFYYDPGEIFVLKPASEGYQHDAPVFGINTEVIPTETTTWGGIKAMFE